MPTVGPHEYNTPVGVSNRHMNCQTITQTFPILGLFKWDYRFLSDRMRVAPISLLKPLFFKIIEKHEHCIYPLYSAWPQEHITD